MAADFQEGCLDQVPKITRMEKAWTNRRLELLFQGMMADLGINYRSAFWMAEYGAKLIRLEEGEEWGIKKSHKRMPRKMVTLAN